MLNILLSNSDLFDKLYQEINRQDTFYFWYISALMVVLGIVLGFFGVLQWRLSEKQVEKIKLKTEEELGKKYEFDQIKDLSGKVKEINIKLEKLRDIENLQKIQGENLIGELNETWPKIMKDPRNGYIYANRTCRLLKELEENKMVSEIEKAVSIYNVWNNFSNLQSNGYDKRSVKLVIDYINKHYIEYIQLMGKLVEKAKK